MATREAFIAQNPQWERGPELTLRRSSRNRAAPRATPGPAAKCIRGSRNAIVRFPARQWPLLRALRDRSGHTADVLGAPAKLQGTRFEGMTVSGRTAFCLPVDGYPGGMEPTTNGLTGSKRHRRFQA